MEKIEIKHGIIWLVRGHNFQWVRVDLLSSRTQFFPFLPPIFSFAYIKFCEIIEVILTFVQKSLKARFWKNPSNQFSQNKLALLVKQLRNSSKITESEIWKKIAKFFEILVVEFFCERDFEKTCQINSVKNNSRYKRNS